VAITVSLNLEAAEKRQLARILGVTQAQLDVRLEGFATAALEEYVRMFLGQRVFTRGSDMREYRLLLLIKSAFSNEFPDDQVVSDLFQTTLSESRSLIRSVASKFQYELQDARQATLRRAIHSAQQQGDEWLISVNSQHIVDQLNRELSAIDTRLPPVKLSPNTLSTFVIPAVSYQQLLPRYP
jgi:hypothetical protein